jgi:hypothetical protein
VATLLSPDTDGAPLATLHHDAEVGGAAWNGDETRILTWSDDNTARLWDVAALLSPDTDGAPLATLHHDAEVGGAAWNGDGSHILTWSDDGTAKIHYASSADLIAQACHVASRNFSLDEWRSYMGTLPYRRTCERLPLHPSYRDDVAERLASGALSEASAIAEVARALGVDPYDTGEPPAEYLREAEEIVAGMPALFATPTTEPYLAPSPTTDPYPAPPSSATPTLPTLSATATSP